VNREPADLRRRQIADAALTVIAEEGLARFTALAIARRVGLSDGALFRHFATKDAIVLAAIERVEELFFGDPLPVHPDPIERLGAFFERRLTLIREHPGIARLVNSGELAQAAPPEGVARVAAMKRRSMGFVRGCLQEAFEAGELRAIRPDEAMAVVAGSLYALGHMTFDAAHAPDLQRRVWRQLERFLRGDVRSVRASRARTKRAVHARAPAPRRPQTGGR
jgi:AcrR family transcriptional regulator